MDVAPLERHAASLRQPLTLDDWAHRLQAICGHYQPKGYCGQTMVMGHVGLLHAGGLEVAHIANDLGEVCRGEEDIRRDYAENLFLLIQLEGTCGIEQTGHQELLSPGDCILIDSARPSIFHFGGNYSNHISVHLPRQILFSKTSQALDVARRLQARDPMSVMLGSLVAKLIEAEDVQDKRTPHLQQLLFDATRQAFATDEEIEVLPRTASGANSGGRLEIVQVLIDRHLTDEALSPRWLAEKLGISLRTLQDDFSGWGTTPTSLIRLRRLHLAREHLRQHRGQVGPRPNIANVAFSAGFNDISYFNRCFRETFHCTPKDFLSEGKVEIVQDKSPCN